MRIIFALILASLATDADAQQCPACTLADSCIREYSAAVAKIRSQARKGEADFQKGMRDLDLGEKGDTLARRGMQQMRENMKLLVRTEIESLKECLKKIK